MDNIEQRIMQVRNDREHGSRWLVREAILILRDLAQMQMPSQDEQMRRLCSSAQDLARARPAMAALSSAVSRILHVQDGPAAVAREANRLLEEYDAATERIAAHVGPYLHGRLITCSISGTVLETLIACRQSIEHVIVLEGRPRYEGRDMAQALSKQSLTVTLITDAQADIFMPQCQGVVVGADSVLADGSVLNKAGTALLAWSAHGHHIPFYVLCETLKISSQSWSGDLTLLEEKEPEEVLEPAIPGIAVRNFYFDRTPHELINKLITERGALELPDIEKIAEKVKEERAFLAHC